MTFSYQSAFSVEPLVVMEWSDVAPEHAAVKATGSSESLLLVCIIAVGVVADEDITIRNDLLAYL